MALRVYCWLLVPLSACATPDIRSPQELYARVATFAQPTHEGRLGALEALLATESLPYAIEEFAGSRPAPDRGRNVIVRSGPVNGSAILLVAHYDAAALSPGILADGLVDNAASVVAMIEAMRRLTGRTRHRLELLLSDEEELGLTGAREFLRIRDPKSFAVAINADVAGYGDTLIYGLNNGPQSAMINAAVDDLCQARAVACLGLPVYPPSDDVIFSSVGIPTVSIGVLPQQEARELRSFMIAPSTVGGLPEILTILHTAEDRINRIEPATLAANADFLTALVDKLDHDLP